MPVEGALSPINCSRFLQADRPDLHVDPKRLSRLYLLDQP
jgi:hypothetical protein